MPKLRQNFSLDTSTIELLKSVENKSQIVDEAIPFYLNNKDKSENPPISRGKIIGVKI